MEAGPQVKKSSVDWQKIIADGQPFTDAEFPPEASSLLNEAWSAGTVWKRASEIFPDGYMLFPPQINFMDVRQGAIGDCYFITCLTELCDGGQAPRVKKLFKTQEHNKAGIYVLNLCVNGLWEEVVIDDYLPCNLDGSLKFCKNNLFDPEG